MLRPGGYTLVLNPIVFSKTETCRFSRVLIEGAAASTSYTAPQWRSWEFL
jgi:hypothetical protein